ncbi:MAG: oligosaccharyl transferase, archaeosortase A system-associated [Candidatus Methanoperedens sp.]|nr:oligosaccharyl transferase, archaeosortase A system-associated [Candidatus Methanoperedens sp.]
MAKGKPTKKFKGKTIGKEENAKEKNGSGSIFPVKYLSYVMLFAIFLFSFYIRGITPIKNVFNRGIVGFASDDAIFHMRLVENTIQFFPHRLFFDAYTLYPYGTPLHWGPLFDQMIAFFSIFAGLITGSGMPSQSTIDTIGAFYPAVLGALVVFPVYFIGKELADEKAGLLGAFLIAILPGQFLSRSVLGFTDNHVAEVFYLAMMMMFFIMAIKKAENITFDHWLKRDWQSLKTPLTYSIFAGLSFGGYLLNWTAGVFFAVVFGIFVVVQYVIDHFRGKSTEYLGIVGIIAYLIAMVMVLPYVDLRNGFSSGYYSLLHVAVTGGGAAVFALLSIVSREMNKRELSGTHYLLFVSGTIIIGLIALKLIVPGLYDASVGNWDFIFHGQQGGGLTIAEAYPITTDMLFENFGYNYYLAYIGILALGYYIVRRSRAEYTLTAVWGVFVLAIMLAQNRFAYYYAVNAAILVGFIGSKALDFGDWKEFGSCDVVECAKKIRIQHILSLGLVVGIAGFLNAPSYASPYKTSMESAQWGAIAPGYYEWYDGLNWMRYNTPDPGLKYYDIYERPVNSTYPYPESAYGVMSWWDYGHVITYFGHRIPNANPFQEGIGGGDTHAPGASTFLIAPTEEKANEVLDKLGINGKPGARYVASNAYMAYSILTVFAEWDLSDQGYYTQIQTSQGTIVVPTPKYYGTMEAKLHIFDGNNLKTYRMVHETQSNWQTRGGINEIGVSQQANGQLQPLCDGGVCNGKFWYNQVYGGNLPLEYSGYVKIFEHVKGAKITGRAPPNTTVTLTNTIKTNIGRSIQYSQTTSSDGTYEFTVPYSTQGPIAGETNFDTKPAGAYTITAGNISKQVDVGEREVLDGGTVKLDLV